MSLTNDIAHTSSDPSDTKKMSTDYLPAAVVLVHFNAPPETSVLSIFQSLNL